MDSRSSSAQSSIRSFFQPLQQGGSNSTPTPPPAAAQPLPLRQNQYLPPPPPVKRPSSYALPPSQQSPSSLLPQQQPLTPPPSSKQTTSSSILPKEAAILPPHPDQTLPLRRINALLLPIAYPDSFYTTLTAEGSSQSTFSRVITWEGKVVGGIICRLDSSLDTQLQAPQSHASPAPKIYNEAGVHKNEFAQGGEYDLYIQSLCLLSPYRNLGLATLALQEVVSQAASVSTAAGEGGGRIKSLYAHVWTFNEEALEWYGKKGFVVTGGEVKGYYRKLKPDGAWILRREIGVKDHLTSQSQSQKQLLSAPQIPERKTPTPTPTPTLAPVENNTATISPQSGNQRPPQPAQARSFQDRGPAREWNDLPEDVTSTSNGLLRPGGSTAASSRSSSRSGGGGGKKKKERVYPAAAFGA